MHGGTMSTARSTITTSTRRARTLARGPKRLEHVAPAPTVDDAVQSLVAWAIEEGMRTGDLDDLVLDAHLDVARLDHVPEHVKIVGQRDFACEAKEDVAYDRALEVNLSGFNRQFRFLVERLPEVRPTPPDPAADPKNPIELVRAWVERYRAG